MIIARNDIPFKCYMTVWSLTSAEKYTDARTSTSEKNQSGEYINSNWFVRFLGEAHKKAQTLEVRDRIIVNSMKFTNESYTAKDGTKKSSLKILIFDFNVQDGDGNSNTSAKASAKSSAKPAAKKPAAKKEVEMPESSEDLPF